MNPRIAKLITNYQKDHNDEAILTLWQDFQPLVISSMQKFYIPANERSDVSQEAFIKLLECAKTYDMTQKVPFESYYKMQLHYWFLNQVRQKNPELLVVDHKWSTGLSMTDLVESTRGNAQELLVSNERAKKLTKAFKTLTQKQAQAVTLYYFNRLPLAQIAKEMKCSYKVAYKHKTAGLKKMKKHLEDYF